MGKLRKTVKFQEKTVNDNEFEFAKKIIDEAVVPSIQKHVEKLNEVLSKHGIRAGVSLTWMFDKLEAVQDEIKIKEKGESDDREKSQKNAEKTG